MSAQLSDDGSGAFVSSDITCQLSCSSSQLQHVSSAAFYSSDNNLCLADQYLGCNQSSLAAMCDYFGSAQTQIVSWDATRKSSTQLPPPVGLHMISFSVLCERLVQSVSCANAMSAQLQCFSSNVTVHCVHQMTASS